MKVLHTNGRVTRIHMESPLTFKDWLLVLLVILAILAIFLIMDQIPFTRFLLDRIKDFSEHEIEYISWKLLSIFT